MDKTLYHGTSTSCLAQIKQRGYLALPYLTDDEDLGWYYADCAVDEDDSEAVLLSVTVDTEVLSVDFNALAEPVMRCEAAVLSTYQRMCQDNNWTQMPDNCWQQSLALTGSVRAKHNIDFSQIVHVEVYDENY